MISKTFFKETKELFREGRVRISLIIVLLLLGVSVWISTRQFQNVNAQYAMAKTSERDVWDNQGEKNPHSAAHYGTYAFKPKYPLSLVDQGVDKYAGTSIFLEAHKRNEAQFSAAADQTGLARFGDLTPDFILLFILPLLIILLGYNSFTKEREMGTLTLLKSQGVSNWKWLLGKWSALFMPVLIITLTLFLIAGILLDNLQDFGVFNWNSLGVMFLVYMVYYAVFINIILLISSLVKKSGIALVASLCIWILACLAAPKAASNIAENKYPYPTRQEFAANVLQDKKEGLDGHDPWSKEAKQLEKQVLQEYGVDSLHQLPFNFNAYRMQKGEEHEAEIYFKHYNYLKEQYSNQSNIYRSLASISPYLPTRFLSMAIAHTDYDTHWDFADAAETYRIATQEFLNGNTAKNTQYGERGYKASADFWKQLPAFQYDPPELGSVLNRNTSNMVVLATWLFATFGLLFFTTKTL
ncbi:ABC transporter permease [Maribacter sp. 2307UL18-2]|uniref:ABC transporter permease n=1 Tax=Maribacter sp. 2307UL18-2 TaxID=3386274 RepID=UPI0039BC4E8E